MLLKIEQEMRHVTKNSKYHVVVSQEFSILSSSSGTETWRRWRFLLEIGEADLLKKAAFRKSRTKSNVHIEHNKCIGNVCYKNDCQEDRCSMHPEILKAKNISADGWRSGRRIIELQVLLSSLKFCQGCKLWSVPLTYYNIIGEMRRGLCGYIYVKCQNPDCGKNTQIEKVQARNTILCC